MPNPSSDPFFASLAGGLSLDPFASFLLAVSVGIGLILWLYSSRFPGTVRFFFLMLFFFVDAVILFGVDNLVVFYIVWEIAAFFAWGIGRLDAEGTAASGAWPITVMGLLASLAMFIGLGALQQQNGSFSLAALRSDGVEWVSLLLLLAVVLKSLSLVGQTTREGRRRLGGAAGAFLLSAGVFVIGIYPYGKLLLGGFAAFALWREAALWLALGLAVVSGLAALGEADTRRSLADTALAQLLILFAALALPRVSGAGLAGGILFLPVYGLAVVALFVALGLVETSTGERNIASLGGLAEHLPFVALVFLVGSLALASLPPLGAFVGQVVIASSLLRLTSVWPAVLYGFALLLALLNLLRLFRGIFLGHGEWLAQGRQPRSADLALATTGVMLALTALLPFWSAGLVEPVVDHLLR